jgi:hypothetical protein
MGHNGATAALRKVFAGELTGPDDPSYDEARTVFNAMIDRRPAVIARCATTADVAAAVDFARENELVVAVRGGGHSVAGLSVCEGGILIDLAGLNWIAVDPEAKTARAGGGVLWGEFDAATQEHGLHTPGGRVTTTGIGGFTTGGGYGWTSSKYGLACDNLISAQVVLADGSIVNASEQQNEDLFWGIRGGGGNFGIVTEFEFRLHELGPIVLAGLALWPLDRAPDVLRGWRDYVDSAPDELSTACVIVTAPVGCINSVSCCGGFVFVDESAEQVASAHCRVHGVAARRSHPDRVGRLQIECPVRATPVVMPYIDAENTLELPAAEDQQPIKTLPTNAAHPTLDVRVRVRRLEGRPDDVHPLCAEDGVEGAAELRVTVAEPAARRPWRTRRGGRARATATASRTRDTRKERSIRRCFQTPAPADSQNRNLALKPLRGRSAAAGELRAHPPQGPSLAPKLRSRMKWCASEIWATLAAA